MLTLTSARDKCGLHCGRAIAAPLGSWIDPVGSAGDNVALARPGRANDRGRRHGEAEESGQGVQPQPRNRLAPQRDRFRPGGAGRRGAAAAEQAPPGAVSRSGGGAPPAERSAAPPGRPARSAGRTRRGRGHGVQPGGAAQDGRERSDRAAQPLPGGAALRAAGPRGRRSRPLEAGGREGALQQADAASSRGSAGEAAPAAGAKRRPAWCLMHCASHHAYNHRLGFGLGMPYVALQRSAFEADFVGAEA